MRHAIAAIVMLAAVPGMSWAASSAVPLDKAPIDVGNKASLQRGAGLYVNYCHGCHGLQFQRYQRLGRDIGLTDEQVVNNLIFTDARIGDTMQSAMAVASADAANWFGVMPPDLSLIARSRGVDYLYTYLRTFYLDDSRPLGVNNAAFPLVGMPHPLWELQGWQRAVVEAETDRDGNTRETIVGFELVEEGSMSPAEYDRAVADLVAFLSYVGEPIQLERQRIGFWVLAFLALCIVVFYLLKKEYWRDVH